MKKFHLDFLMGFFYRISKQKNGFHFYHYYDITFHIMIFHIRIRLDTDTRKRNESVWWDKDLIINNIEFLFLALNIFTASIVQKRIRREERYFFTYFFRRILKMRVKCVLVFIKMKHACYSYLYWSLFILYCSPIRSG